MSACADTELHRDFGRMEGVVNAMSDRLSKIESIMERMDKRLAKIEQRNSEMRGAWWVLGGLGAVFGGSLVAFLGHFWK